MFGGIHVPVLAITGMQETSVLGTGYQQEVALDRLYADVAEYDIMISNPVQINAVTDLAIRTAYARRGVAHITVPNDIQVADADADPWQHVAPASPPKTAPVYLEQPGTPSAEELRRLADYLNAGNKIAILAGAGALHAREELLATAEALGAPIVKTLPGKATVPDDSPYTTGGIGLLGTKPSEDLMDEIDTLFSEEVRAGVPARPAAQGHDRDHPAQGQDPAAQVIRIQLSRTVPRPTRRGHAHPEPGCV
jgi:pyruvate dehydrogenase (quinone)